MFATPKSYAPQYPQANGERETRCKDSRRNVTKALLNCGCGSGSGSGHHGHRGQQTVASEHCAAGGAQRAHGEGSPRLERQGKRTRRIRCVVATRAGYISRLYIHTGLMLRASAGAHLRRRLPQRVLGEHVAQRSMTRGGHS